MEEFLNSPFASSPFEHFANDEGPMQTYGLLHAFQDQRFRTFGINLDQVHNRQLLCFDELINRNDFDQELIKVTTLLHEFERKAGTGRQITGGIKLGPTIPVADSGADALDILEFIQRD